MLGYQDSLIPALLFSPALFSLALRSPTQWGILSRVV